MGQEFGTQLEVLLFHMALTEATGWNSAGRVARLNNFTCMSGVLGGMAGRLVTAGHTCETSPVSG